LSEVKRAPVMTACEAVKFLEQRRAPWYTVVFTNGCFDLLHPGHLEILEKSRAMGDLLVVGVNTDESVKRLKGPSRPVQSLDSRVAVLSAIRFVDCVVPFSEDTPEELISVLLPDVLVKGGDYTVDTVVGAETVLRMGGRVEIVPVLKGYSTTALLKDLT